MNGFAHKGRRYNQDCEDEVEMNQSHSKTNRWTTNILHWIPREKKRPRGRPNARWEDEIKHFFRSYMDEYSNRP